MQSTIPTFSPTTYHTTIPSAFPSAPSFHFQLTRFRDTLFVWIGSGSASDAQGELDGAAGPSERRVGGDWAVAMPKRGVGVGLVLIRSIRVEAVSSPVVLPHQSFGQWEEVLAERN